ncbi:MAG TPA: carboxypeptidase regulatory-like domain-containing protein, partial [Bryobacteraceae bacterium]|nr:carboxypeptidase regulatory-like domain-containing protein [Bryobacteraceae bacterium]
MKPAGGGSSRFILLGAGFITIALAWQMRWRRYLAFARRGAFLLVLCLPTFAATLNITVKDPSNAFVFGAAVTVTPQNGPSQNKSTDLQGEAAFDLPAGQYHVSAIHTGFEPAERDATIANRPVDLTITLRIAAASTTMQVSGKRSPLANSDPNYRALRKGRLTQIYRVSNLTLTRDAGTFQFRSGSFSFLPSVLGRVTTGVFIGDGNFQLKPAFDIAANLLHHMTGADTVNEDFTALVVYFSDSTFDEVKRNGHLADESTQQEEDALKRVKELIETRREPNLLTRPLTMLERMLTYEDIPNYEAEVLEELYNKENPGSFRAFIRGKKYPDLRFLLNPHGAMPNLPAAEEIALLNFDPNSFSDGIWYLSHFASELRAGRASSKEDKRLIAPEHYKLDTLIRRANLVGNIPDLAVTCDLRFRALQDGVRMVKFDMVPDLQVARVTFNGSDIPFVQESRAHDGSFYLQMPEPLVKNRTYNVAFEYSGGEILQSRYAIPNRRVWYPTPAGASSRATYDMTFRIPHRDRVVAAGELINQSREGDFDTSQWVSNQPIAQAVFRYTADDHASSKSEVETMTSTPMTAIVATGGRGMVPPSLNNILIATGNSLRVFSQWFGKPANPGITVCVGCGFDSLPGMVFV